MLNTGLTPGASYLYRLRARNAGGISAWSAEASVTMPEFGAQGVPFDGLRLWLHPAGTNGSGNAVQTWNDWSGNKTHAAAANAAARPQLVSGVLGGRSVVRFDGTVSQLAFPTSAFSGAREMEQYVVLKAKTGAPAGRQAYALGHYGAAVQYPAADGTIRDNLGKLGTPETISFPAGTNAWDWHVYHTRVTAQSRLARVDGQLVHQSTGISSIYTYPWSYLGKVGSNAWAGDIAEVLVYERALTVAEHTAVQNYLAQKYQLSPLAAPEPVSVPDGIAVALTATDAITVTWNTVPEAGVSYELQVRAPGREYRTLAVLPSGTTSHTHTDLNPETDYTYRVRVRAPLGISAWSLEAATTTPALPPPTANDQPPSTGLRLWLQAGVGLTLDEQGMVARWADQSGRGNHAGHMPDGDYWIWSGLTPVEDSQLGTVVRSEYGDGLPLPALMNEATGGEVFLVVKADDSYDSVTPFTLGHTFYYPQWRDYYYDPENPYSETDIISDSFGRSTTVDMTVPENKPVRGHWRLYNVSASADGWAARLDNEPLGEAEGGPLVFGSYGTIGGGMGGPTEIAEILVYHRALGQTEKESVAAYLGQKYQLNVVLPPELQPPAAPSDLTATATGQTSIALAWTASATEGAAYELERKAGGSDSTAPYGKIADLAAGATSHTDIGLTPATTYTYRLRAVKDGRTSSFTLGVTATTDDPQPVSSNLRLWLKADAGVVTDGAGKVSQWTDQSGRNNHASQNTADARPQPVAAATPGGVPAVRFDGTDSHLSFGNLYTIPSGSPSAEVFVVLRAQQGGTAGRYAFALSHHGGLKYPASDGVLSDDFGRLVNPVSLAVPNGVDLSGWHIYNAANGGASRDWVARLDGAIIGRADSNGNPYWYPWSYLGRGAAYSNSFWAGDIAEVLVYDRALSQEEREQTEYYLRSRHGFGQPAVPATPAAPTVDVLSATRALISWEMMAQPATCELQRREQPNGTWEDISVAGRLSVLDEGLMPGTAYAYRLRARNAGGVSAWSADVSVTMPTAGEQGVPFDGMRLWLHPAGTDANGDGAVQTWSDWSGRKTHATAANAAARPQLVPGVWGGRSVVRFDGAGQLGFPTSSFSGAREMEQFVVLKAKAGSPAGRRAYALGHYGSAVQYPAPDGTIRDNLGQLTGNAEVIPFPAETNAHGWHVYHTRLTAQSRLARVDGQLVHQSAGISSIYTYPWSYLGKVSGDGWAGDIAEVFVYDRALTVAEHAAVQNYLVQKYQLPPPAAPEPVSTPTGISASVSAPDTITVTWDTVPEAGSSYELQVLLPGREYRTLAVLPPGTTSHAHTDLNPDATYTYRIRTRAPLGISAWSEEASATTPALPPPADGQPPSTGLRLWLRADIGLTLDDQGMVAHWADQSGRGNHAGQMPSEDYWIWSGLTPTEDPQLGPVVQAEGWSDGLPLPALMNEATGGEVFVVLKTSDSYDDITPFTLGHTFYYPRWRDYYYDPENPYPETDIIADSFGRSAAIDMAVPEGKPIRDHWRLYNVNASTNGWAARLDHELLGEADGGPLVFGQYGTIGGGMGGPTQIAEILVYHRALGEAERETVAAYLGQKYQLDVVLPPGTQPPAPPENFTATATGQTTIALAWTASPTEGSAYELERKLGDAGSTAPYTKIADIAADTTSHTDTGLSSAATYTYRLRAVKAGLHSGYTAEAVATTKLTVPDNFTAEAVAWNTVSLSWMPVPESGATYELERKPAAGEGGFENIAGLPAGTAAHTDAGLSPETGYIYRLRAVLGGNVSDYTGALLVTTPPQPPQPPGPPASLTAATTSANNIELAWTASPTEGAAYELERKTGDGSFEKIADLGSGVVFHLDAGLAGGMIYTYRIRAAKGGIFSDYSEEVQVRMVGNAPDAVIVSPIDGTTLAWNQALAIECVATPADDANPIAKLRLFRDGIPVAESDQSSLELVLPSVEPGVHSLAVLATTVWGAEKWSDPVTINVTAQLENSPAPSTYSPSYGVVWRQLAPMAGSEAGVTEVGMPLRTAAWWQGKVTGVSGQQVQVDLGSDSQLPDFFASGNTAMMEVLDSPTSTGMFFTVTGVDGDTWLCAVNAPVQAGDIVAVRPLSGLDEIVSKATNESWPGSDIPATADTVELNRVSISPEGWPVAGGIFTAYYKDASSQWRASDSSAPEVPLVFPGQSLRITRKTGHPVTWMQTGNVRKWTALTARLSPGAQWVSADNLVPLPLKRWPWGASSSNGQLVGGTDPLQSDLVSASVADGRHVFYLHREDGTEWEWRRADAPEFPAGHELVTPLSTFEINSFPSGGDPVRLSLPRGF
ncbi:fibronectin type III domain-containing protein [Termitidicoccus mucosus]|uniref:fibronectin type III domain-containing protein n=1 Tax=Termitidicoccus mucosus TaxID=1184151 RepID=UPI002FEE3708